MRNVSGKLFGKRKWRKYIETAYLDTIFLYK